ncbi:hypothetical protein [Paragemmobacter ruber]|uniref:Uncharacterized protein n=1 Tax=Paragemmobacter ruber TaxID=1985673 RepID=A0ABW9Y760_9RHOB|nr:hypothetical protein [Rhodobacter ruber]NBE07640.1 hypothetical protein [Rhodobacter ruber]
MALVLILYPLAVYASLCLLPRGRAGLGIALAGAALAVVWLMHDPVTDDGFTRFLVILGALPVVLAAVAQGVRGLIGPEAPGWLWPAIAVGLGLSGLLLFILML